ncbi:acetyl/propionyl-CoA carboxylase subuit alpha [Marmoricola endophyticus]|uniref:Acetyl/propionyl-CoA carboxylase subuit alpha n=1 Tax=Marmoricola endophyticus TaxID=2040280 RepID=A0A917F3V5_9ACTN|nr:biotin carboxylase N-terminal domain-containing protein [Marmoricola endophyticus]GGF47711.1 acetyl/propionyl-CoA carboxylase subuit alpha [Marmoricola endophyticus]
MDRLLIANRGEIALRVARTAERLGIDAVMIHTAADEHAPHAGASEYVAEVSSYLDIDAVVDAAVRSEADAVHPGYGFLSERAAFASALEAAGITLVGPSAAVMDAMGRKDAAREIAVAAGVPVVPSYSLSQATADPSALSYPVLVKAAAGGGGKGMRTVRSAADLAEAVEAAKREARSAFGDDAMLIEKYVEHGRHVEVQVMGDAHGTVLHLWHRDCSAQRRHQKVVEEAPAPDLPPGVEDTVLTSAVALAQQVGYTGAGTVEFLLDTDTGEVYFLEMNTRLQVEHPVTEAITGLDLVELQLRVADGEPIGLTQEDVRCEGHAMEARVYAEDAWHGFLPQAGTATVVRWPGGVRVDHALGSGQEVSTGFDPMLGKVVAHADDREQARDLLVQALDRTAILGLTTNTGFLRALVDSPEFAAGPVDTAWLDTSPLTAPDDSGARALAGVVLDQELRSAPAAPWQPDGFRLGGPRGPLVEDGRVLEFSGWVAAPGAPDADGLVRTGILGVGDGVVQRTRSGTEVVVSGQRFLLDRADPFRRTTTAGDGTLTAPMPGTVLAVSVAEGDTVEEGQTLGVLEAMKMEVALKAAYAGTVAEVGAAAGEQVALGAVLFVVEEAEHA